MKILLSLLKVIKLFILLCILSFILICYITEVKAKADDNLPSEIGQLIKLGKKAPRTLSESIIKKIEENPETALKFLLSKANSPQITESELSVYIWGIGFTKSPKAVDDIIRLTSGKTNDILIGNSITALTTIGGEQSGNYLLDQLKKISKEDIRFEILNSLGQMQFEQALPSMLEILEKDPQKYYWQSIFVFGKMGDKGVPFLLEKNDFKDG